MPACELHLLRLIAVRTVHITIRITVALAGFARKSLNYYFITVESVKPWQAHRAQKSAVRAVGTAASFSVPYFFGFSAQTCSSHSLIWLMRPGRGFCFP